MVFPPARLPGTQASWSQLAENGHFDDVLVCAMARRCMDKTAKNISNGL